MMRLFRNLVLMLVCVTMTGCGFAFRGEIDLPPDVETLYIRTNDRFSPFYRELVAAIKTNGLELVDNSIDADAVIDVLEDVTDRRTLSVSARNIPVEFEIYYIVTVSVFIGAQQIVDRQRFVLTRDYTYDETEVLGKANEEEVLRDALASNLVGLLTQTISASWQQPVIDMSGDMVVPES